MKYKQDSYHQINGSIDKRQSPDKSAPSKSKDRRFDFTRANSSIRMGQIVYDADRAILANDERLGRTKRKPKGDDARALMWAVDHIICNVALAFLTPGPNTVCIARSKGAHVPKRYVPRTTSTFLRALNGLVEVGLIEEVRGGGTDENGRRIRRLTVIRASKWLVDLLRERGIQPQDVRQLAPRETIVLRGRKRRPRFDSKGPLVEYEDNEMTKALRAEVEEINAGLRKANIEVDDKSIDIHRRALYRGFTQGSFACGGRLYGGFWIQMSKADRFDKILIDDWSVVELDYGQMYTRILYGWAARDAYAVRQYVRVPDLSEDLYQRGPLSQFDRDGIKQVMNAILFKQARPTQFMQGVRKYFPKTVSISDVLEAIETAHSDIKHFFYRDIGHELQRAESDIMVKVLRALQRLSIVALPIHDGLLVSCPNRLRVQKVMAKSFYDVVGIDVDVKIRMEP